MSTAAGGRRGRQGNMLRRTARYEITIFSDPEAMLPRAVTGCFIQVV